jgi:23S rRNA pseudouridine1911/1915/1917 synthase
MVRRLNIIHENAMLLVVDKPAGLTVEQVGEQLKEQFPELEQLGRERRYGIAHRLDKDTSGVLLAAKTEEGFEKLQRQFADRRVEKRYICLVEGAISQESGVIHTLLARSPADRRKQRTYPLEEAKEGRREAITEWRVLQRFNDYTLLEVTPKTGRKHQIRAHMVQLGHPVAGDKLYGFKNQRVPEGLTRQFLHASSLKTGNKTFSSDLPQELNNVLNRLQPQKFK